MVVRLLLYNFQLCVQHNWCESSRHFRRVELLTCKMRQSNLIDSQLIARKSFDDDENKDKRVVQEQSYFQNQTGSASGIFFMVPV